MATIRKNPTLSEDLISEILKRVPVKSLLCFQSVCKTWLSLIKHPAFVKSQLLHSITTLTDQTQTLIMHRSRPMKFSLFCANSRQIVSDLTSPYNRDEFKSRPYDSLVGSANGIVCVVVVEILERITSSIYFWNPATRQSKVIPQYSKCDNIGVDVFRWGFGYDQIDQDFKVLRVISLELESGTCFFAEVYSDNRNAWRKVPDPIDIPWNRCFNVCVNGFLCGIGEHGMMAFDLNKEVLNCAIKLPVSYNDNARIIEFNNYCAVIIMTSECNYPETDWRVVEKINLWTLDDDACLRGGGVEASWTQMFSIDIVGLIDIYMPGQIVLGYISNGDLVLLIYNDGYVWISCNADKKEAKIVPLSVDMDNFHLIRVPKYTESLVSLAGFKQVNWNAGEDEI